MTANTSNIDIGDCGIPIKDVPINSQHYSDDIINNIQFTFISLYEADIESYKHVLSEYSNVKFVCTDIIDELTTNMQYDAVVSPSNSFGFMDRGADAAYIRFFGNGLQKSIQELIIEKYHGELVVGAGMMVDLNREENPRYFISIPTARVPGDISTTTNVYYAFRALLNLLERSKNNIKRVLVPCLGTGSGRMPSIRSAVQVKMAFDAFNGVCDDNLSVLGICKSVSWVAAKNNDTYLKTISKNP